MAVSEGTKGIKRAGALIDEALLLARQARGAGTGGQLSFGNSVGTTTAGSGYILGPAQTVKAATAITPTVTGKCLISFAVHAVDSVPGDSVTCTLTIDGTPVLSQAARADAGGNVNFSGSVFTSGHLSGLPALSLGASHAIEATLVASIEGRTLTIAAAHAFVSAIEFPG